MRKCYNCKCNYPLFMFQHSPSPVKWCQNKAYVCKICEFFITKNRVCRKTKDGKFVVIQLSLKERIQELWK